MKVILTTKNRNFSRALVEINLHFSHLLHESLESIELCPKKSHIWSRNLGIHLRENRKSKIFICNGRQTIPQFMNTLVHELTHLRQSLRNEECDKVKNEYEAHDYGNEVQHMYEMKGF